MTETVNLPGESVARDIGRCPVVHLDFSAPQEVGTYWRQADELRGSSPIFFNSFAQGYWIFTRHEQVRDIYRHHEIFSSESITPWDPEPIYRFVPTQIDPPDHLKYRRILNPWFSPAAVDQATDMAREVCRRHVARVAAGAGCDFITEFALHYPTEVFLRMIGLGGSDADSFVQWVEDFFKGFSGDPAGLGPMGRALDGIRNYWVKALEERRGEAEPRAGDLASNLLHSTVDGEPLGEAVILDMLTVLVLAGLDTTRATLGYIFRHLAEHPEDRRRLIEQPELIPSAVEEALRFYTIIFGDGRKVTRDIDFHGVALRKGDMVYALVSGANRDPEAYDHADEFILDRKRNHHLGFASGPHRCLGAHLARREMQLAVEEWLRAIPDFSIATDERLIERGGGAMMSLMSLPLAWERRG